MNLCSASKIDVNEPGREQKAEGNQSKDNKGNLPKINANRFQKPGSEKSAK